jgi:hypothetical protein
MAKVCTKEVTIGIINIALFKEISSAQRGRYGAVIRNERDAHLCIPLSHHTNIDTNINSDIDTHNTMRASIH